MCVLSGSLLFLHHLFFFSFCVKITDLPPCQIHHIEMAQMSRANREKDPGWQISSANCFDCNSSFFNIYLPSNLVPAGRRYSQSNTWAQRMCHNISSGSERLSAASVWPPTTSRSADTCHCVKCVSRDFYQTSLPIVPTDPQPHGRLLQRPHWFNTHFNRLMHVGETSQLCHSFIILYSISHKVNKEFSHSITQHRHFEMERIMNGHPIVIISSKLSVPQSHILCGLSHLCLFVYFCSVIGCRSGSVLMEGCAQPSWDHIQTQLIWHWGELEQQITWRKNGSLYSSFFQFGQIAVLGHNSEIKSLFWRLRGCEYLF